MHGIWAGGLIGFRTKVVNCDEFKTGGLREEHAVANLNLGNHLSVCLKTEEHQGEIVLRWPVAGP
jgi:hypothetical protein